jgi:hypothetical protein
MMVVAAGVEQVPPITSTVKKSDAFIHPGLLNTEADFARRKVKVEAQESP